MHQVLPWILRTLKWLRHNLFHQGAVILVHSSLDSTTKEIFMKLCDVFFGNTDWGLLKAKRKNSAWVSGKPTGRGFVVWEGKIGKGFLGLFKSRIPFGNLTAWVLFSLKYSTGECEVGRMGDLQITSLPPNGKILPSFCSREQHHRMLALESISQKVTFPEGNWGPEKDSNTHTRKSNRVGTKLLIQFFFSITPLSPTPCPFSLFQAILITSLGC